MWGKGGVITWPKTHRKYQALTVPEKIFLQFTLELLQVWCDHCVVQSPSGGGGGGHFMTPPPLGDKHSSDPQS